MQFYFKLKTLQRNKNLKSLPKIQSLQNPDSRGECPWQKKGIYHVVSSAFFYSILCGQSGRIYNGDKILAEGILQSIFLSVHSCCAKLACPFSTIVGPGLLELMLSYLPLIFAM